MRASACFLCLLSCFLFLAACDAYPRDAAATTDRVRAEGVLRVGVIEHHPWAYRDPHGALTGSEARLAAQFARHLDAEPNWLILPENEAFKKLHAREIDLVIGGLLRDNPRRDEATLTRPYLTLHGPEKSEHVMAVMPGESRFLITLERFLKQQPVPPAPEESP